MPLASAALRSALAFNGFIDCVLAGLMYDGHDMAKLLLPKKLQGVSADLLPIFMRTFGMMCMLLGLMRIQAGVALNSKWSYRFGFLSYIMEAGFLLIEIKHKSYNISFDVPECKDLDVLPKPGCDAHVVCGMLGACAVMATWMFLYVLYCRPRTTAVTPHKEKTN
mmetsp:Transcript_34997/g.67667  ORF Transcript_34997/g.67667 Transcript_34997/m.67667 type:complete len:165 (+) Transcript_34997:431-925(+)